MIQDVVKKWGKHVLAIVIFLVLTIVYFSPAILDGKRIQNADMTNVYGMGSSQMEEYAQTAQPGEFSEWSDAMFGGMPYVTHYGHAAPNLPGYEVLEKPLKGIDYVHGGMVFVGLVCFYLLMCVMGVNWLLAIAGAIAFAFASYNIILVLAGHVTKAYVIAYMPVVLAGMVLLFKRNYMWGGILFLLGVALSVGNSHLQITYYLVLLCVFIYLGYLTWQIKQKAYKELGKVTAILIACVLLAVLPNARNMYVHWDLGQSSTRGATELTTAGASGEKISSGLDKDYAFQWSYGKSELLTLLIPHAYGGGSGGTLDSSSEFYKSLKAAGYQVKNEMQAPTYWGDKPFTQGPVYFGAGVCFLFVLGMFVIRNKMKWWLFAGGFFLVLLALGRNLDWFNDIMFHYLPMYNKFRTVEMALVIPGLVAPIIAFWGLKEIVNEQVDLSLLKKGLIGSVALTGGLCLLIWLFPSLLLSFQSNYDAQYQEQPWYAALLMDRSSLASSDAFRSFLFILLTAGLVFFFLKAKNKKRASLILCIGVTLFTLADLWTVDRRYLNDKNYVKEKPADIYKASVADKEILKDPAISYRVVNLNNPFQETTTSYFHHSIGGYHAAKLRRYQELIDHRLSQELSTVIQAFQKATSLEDIQKVFSQTPSLNMLNTKYVIYHPEQAPVENPFIYGNAWFVPEVRIVENADAEMEALHTIHPLQTAVVDKRFTEELNGFQAQPDSMASITLDNYRPNRLTYTTKAVTEQIAVFSEVFYQPGWKVTIDGQPASHFRADWILRAMRVPAGEHQLVFEFRPEGYIVAANISAYSSFLILLLFIAVIGYSVWKVFRPSTQQENKEE